MGCHALQFDRSIEWYQYFGGNCFLYPLEWLWEYSGWSTLKIQADTVFWAMMTSNSVDTNFSDESDASIFRVEKYSLYSSALYIRAFKNTISRGPQWYKVRLRYQIPPNGFRVETWGRTKGQSDMMSTICVNFMRIEQITHCVNFSRARLPLMTCIELWTLLRPFVSS
jgi:hypothetical protein